MGRISTVTSFWSGLAAPGRRLIIGAAVIFVVGLYLLFQLSGKTDYATLATASSPADAAAITQELDAKGIPYRLRDGTTVQVPAASVDQARLDLAASDVLSAGGSKVDYSIFDKQSFGATDFTQKVNLVRAMQGELSKTIAQLDQVQAATVSIAMPTQRLFSNDQDPVTASVLVDLAPGDTLSPGQVTGVTRLVSMSVPGLKADNVTITDTSGNILQGGATDGVDAQSASRLGLERGYEQATEAKINALLAQTLGPGMAVAAVNATLDLDRQKQETETFSLPKGQKAGIPLTENNTEEELTGGAAAPGGAAGTTSNTPGNTFPSTATGNGTSGYTKTTTQEQNGVDRVRTSTEVTPGQVERQTISVLVSDKATGANVQTLTTAIENAVGFDSQRGDLVSVESVTFGQNATAGKAPEGAATATSGGGQPFDVMTIAKTAGALIGFILILLIARKSLRRRQGELERVLPELLQRGPVPVAELTGGAGGGASGRLEGQTKSPLEQQMEDLALRKPDDMAKLMRSWLIERR
jgi:flagellar M-ring protein FliF